MTARCRGGEVGELELGQAHPAALVDSPEVDLAAQIAARRSRRSTPRKIEMRPRNPRNSTLNRMTATSVMVRGQRLQLEVRPRDGGEVEADEGDDRAGDDRRHELVDPAEAGELHDEADGGEQDADGHDSGERRARARRSRWRR